MNLEEFRARVQGYRQFTGKSQQALARELNLNPQVLSQKLNNLRQARLYLDEIKNLILILAKWQAVTTRSQVVELLALMDLKPQTFSAQEWASPPLSELEAAPAEGQGSLFKASAGSATEKIPTTAVTRPAKSPAGPKLPAQSTLLIGRNQLIAQCYRLLRQDKVRLLTLTGPGGVGKTRLGLAVAEECQKDFKDGVFWVEMAGLQDTGLVPRHIAAALGLKETAQVDAIEQLKGFLHDKSVLLLLDNFEQLLPAARTLTALMAEAPGLKIMVTSQTLLQLYGEFELVVPPLTLPDDIPEAGLLNLENVSAIQLFVERAQAARSDFALTADNINLIWKICEWLDGLPLAIELAAAWSKFFSPAALLEYLTNGDSDTPQTGNRLGLMTTGSANLPARHQTLRSTIDLSFNLLSPSAQHLFIQLGIFSGSFSLEAVLAICYLPGASPDKMTMLELVRTLANHSLLQYLPAGPEEQRFSLLETLREYSLKLLLQSEDSATLREWHFSYFLDLAKRAEPELQKAQQIWVERLKREEGNLRAALEWCKESDTRNGLLLQLVSNLWRFWLLTGRFSIGRLYLEDALKRTGNNGLQETIDYAKSLSGLGVLLFYQGENDLASQVDSKCLVLMEKLNYKRGIAACLNNLAMIAQRRDSNEAYDLYSRSLEIMRELQDPVGVGVCLNNLGTICKILGHYRLARTMYIESLEIRERLEDKQGMGVCFNNLGRLAEIENDFDLAYHYYSKGLSLRSEIADKQGMGICLLNLGVIAQAQGKIREAETCYEKGLNLLKELGAKFSMALGYNNLGLINYVQGNYYQAEQYFVESILLSRNLSYKQAIATGLIGLALLANRNNQPRLAVQLVATVDTYLDGGSYTKNMHLHFSELYNELLVSLKTSLDEASFERYRAEIKALPAAQQLEFGLTQLD